MVRWLLEIGFQCAHCQEPLCSPQSFPLCNTCQSSLIPAKSLCSQCGNPDCPHTGTMCLRPWVCFSPIRSFHAGYVLVGRSYSLFKSWKRRGGLFFDRSLLNPTLPCLTSLAKLSVDCIVPIPPRAERLQMLQSDPPSKISRWLSRHLQKPIVFLPWILEKSLKHQAELRQVERFQNPASLSISLASPLPFASSIGSRVLLVDDLMTTGKTLYEIALELIQKHAIHEIHAFVLGRKPNRSLTEEGQVAEE